jgi:hypothetical protein
MFFLIRDWEREMVEPCLLAREIEVALDIEAASFMSVVEKGGDSLIRLCSRKFDVTRLAYVIVVTP